MNTSLTTSHDIDINELAELLQDPVVLARRAHLKRREQFELVRRGQWDGISNREDQLRTFLDDNLDQVLPAVRTTMRVVVVGVAFTVIASVLSMALWYALVGALVSLSIMAMCWDSMEVQQRARVKRWLSLGGAFSMEALLLVYEFCWRFLTAEYDVPIRRWPSWL